MFRFSRQLTKLLIVCLLTLTSAAQLAAQNGKKPPADGGGGGVTPACVGGCNTYSVSVTPDGGSEPTRAPYTWGYATPKFTVYNNGTTNDTYYYSCLGTGGVVCDSVRPTSASVAAGTYAALFKRPTAYYHVNGAGNGQIKVTASGEAVDNGYYTVPIATPAGAPVLSVAPHNGAYHKVGQCVASCFDLIWGHATPAYYSLGQARSFGLVYNSSTVKPTPVILVDVNAPSGYSPTTYSVQVKLVSTGAMLTLANGSQTVYYTAQGTSVVRLAAAIDAQANGLTTGAYDVLVAVSANYGTGPAVNTIATRLLVVDATTSSYGAGVSVAGLQRIFFQPDGSAFIVEGDGSAAYYQYQYGVPFISPAGAPDKLTSPSGVYRRTSLDGSYLEFNSTGRMTKTVDRFGNTTTLTWTDTLLTSIRDPMNKTITLTYAGGKLSTVKDPAPAQRTTTYTISSGRLVTVKDPDNVSTSLSYNTSTNQLTGITDRGGNLTSITYDAIARVDTVKAPSITLYTGSTARPTTKFRAAEHLAWQPSETGVSQGTAKTSVVASGAEATITDPQGAVTHLLLDRFGAPTKVTDILGQVTIVGRDTLSNVLNVTEPNGHQSQYTYYTATAPPAYSPYLMYQAKDLTTGRTVTFSYTSTGAMASESGGITTRSMVYHNGAQGPAGALKSVSDGGFVTSHWPDSRGRDTLIIHDDTTHKDRFHYDAVWGNADTYTDAGGHALAWHYDNLGRTDTITVSGIRSASRSYGPMNEVLTSTDPQLHSTQYSYDVTGHLVRIVDPKSQVYKFAYNGIGDLVAKHDVGDSTKADTLKYDVMRNVRVVKTRRGDLISNTYNSAGQILTRSGSDFPADTFRYDPAGRWLVGVNAVAYDSFAYDPVGRMTAHVEKLAGHTFQWNYSWDQHNRITARSDPGNLYPTLAIYNSDNTLFSFTAPGGSVYPTTVAERLEGLRKFGPTGAQWTQSRGISKFHRDSIQAYSNGVLNSARALTATFDSLGRLATRKLGNGPTWSITYDSAGRVVNMCRDVFGVCTNEYGGPGMAYRYDSAGNRMLVTDSLNNVSPGNRVLATGYNTYSYDAAGNTITRFVLGVGSYALTWDALGRLQKITDNGNLVDSMGYDAFGRRVRKTSAGGTQWFVHDGDKVALDLDGAFAVTAAYGHHPQTGALLSIQNMAWSGTFITDPFNGSVVGVAGTSGGGPIKLYDPSSAGITTADTGLAVRFRFAGAEYDQESGLYYMGARYYDPLSGRFLSEDPAGLAGGLNLYSYGYGDPINLADPTGLDPTMLDSMRIRAPFTCTDRAWCETSCPIWAAVGICNDPLTGWERDGHEDGGSVADNSPQAPADVNSPSCRNAVLVAAGTILLDFVGTGALIKGGIKAVKAVRFIRKEERVLTFLGGNPYTRRNWANLAGQTRSGLTQWAVGAPTGDVYAAGYTVASNQLADIGIGLLDFVPGVSSVRAANAASNACFGVGLVDLAKRAL